MNRAREESQDELASADGNEKHSARNPACDLCREKKVRCGREKPRCQNCVLWKSHCTYSERQKRDNEVSRNNQRFEEVNERLDRIEAVMSRLVAALESAEKRPAPREPSPPAKTYRPVPVTHTTSSSSVRPRTPKRPASPEETESSISVIRRTRGGKESAVHVADQRGDLQYLGPSSLLSISTEAETLAEEKLGVNAGSTATDDASRREQLETIGALRKLNLVSSKTAKFFPHYGHQELRAGAGDVTMEIPLREEADALVSEYFAKVHHWFPIFDRQRFEADMDRFYLEPEALSKDRAWMTCYFNVLLFGQFNKLAYIDQSKVEARAAVEKRIHLYFFNAWRAIDDLDLFLGPRLRNVQALLTGAVCAIEVSRPGLSWSLLSQAARSSQAIGLHRSTKLSQHISKAAREERQYVFWNVYILDKCLSLAFGRSTCLPDFDIDTELPEDDGSNSSFLAMIKLSQIQSQIYVRLYSASALRQAEVEKSQGIKDLDVALRAWWSVWNQTFADMQDSFEYVELQFSFHSSMTLVHRCARPGMSSYAWSDTECLENARAAIRTINNVVTRNSELATSGMLLWLFQYHPFSSFFVLFSAIIRHPSTPTSSTVDYPLMKTLVSYLSQMQSRNEGAAKLLQIASAFTHVAGTFLRNYRKHQKKTTSTPNPQQPPHKRRRGPDNPITTTEWTPPVADPMFQESYVRTPFPTHPHPPPPPAFQHPQPLASSSSASPSTDEEATSVDLQVASFLRWPGGLQHGEAVEQPSAQSELDCYDIDLEMLMAEPVGFQQQMEAAQMQGPLEFDWMSWDGQFGGGLSR